MYSQTNTNYGMGFQPAAGQPIPQQPVMAQPAVQPGQRIPGLVMPGQKVTYPQEYYEAYNTQCPHCSSIVTTEATYKIGSVNWVWCVLLSCMLLIPFCWVAFLCDLFKDVIHTCPNCKKIIGEYRRKDMVPARRVHVTNY